MRINADWLRNRNTLEFIGIWEKVYNLVLIMANSPQLEINQIAIHQMGILEGDGNNRKLLK